jgi:hypothetical protein
MRCKNGKKMSQDPGFRMLYESRQKTLIDEASKYKYAEKKGREEGLQEGMEKRKISRKRAINPWHA